MRRFARIGLMAASLASAGMIAAVETAPVAQAQPWGYHGGGRPGWSGGRPGWGGPRPGWGYRPSYRRGLGPGAVVGGVLGGLALGAIVGGALNPGYAAPPPVVYAPPPVVYAPPPPPVYYAPPPRVYYYPGY